MTDEELEKLVETQLLSSKKEIIEALKAFQANPDATTFRQAEDIPDELVGRSLDRIIGAVLSETSLNFHAVPHDSKKKWENRGRQKSGIQLKHGGTQAVSLEYYIPRRAERRGRPRKRRTRGCGGTGCFPFAERLGVIAHASPSLSGDVVLESLKDAYAEAAESLARRGIEMSWTRVQKIVNEVGKRGVRERERRLPDIRIIPVAAGRRIAVTIDGGRILTRVAKAGRRNGNGRHGYDAEWREPKMFLIYELDENGRKARGGFQRCGGTLRGPDFLVELIAAELRSMDAGKAECVVFPRDGAKWIWNRIDTMVRQAGLDRRRVCICLDYYHAVEHLTAIADASSPGSRRRQVWMNRMRKLLMEGTPEEIMQELIKCRKRGNSTIRREIQYFTTNMAAMNYASLRLEKLPIGSGSIESAVRRVVNLRIKGAGIFWKIENAEQFLHLRCQLKSGNWNKFYNELISNIAS